LLPEIEKIQQDLQKSSTNSSQNSFESKEMRLYKLVDLYEKGLVSRKEFEIIKQEIFS